MDADAITTGDGTDVVLGDNGTVTYAGATGSLQLSQVVSTVLSRGGDDVILLGNGRKDVVGGFGSDTVTALAGNHVVLGDNGQVDYDTDGAPLVLQTTDTEADSAFGGTDTITLGDGDNIVLGGMDADAITTGDGTDVVLGDNGTVTYAGVTGSLKLSQMVSTVLSRGGNDVILLGNGRKDVVGGYGSDTITALTGDHNVIGDNGRMTYDATGIVKTLETTDTADHPEYGGNDVITLGDGINHVLGGMGSDRITVGEGKGIIFGDNGTIRYAGLAGHLKLQLVISTLPSSGGSDTIVGGGGNKHVIGGYGDDIVTTGSGDDILIGDNGEIQYDSSGVPSLVRSIDPLDGGDDTLTSDGGSDILIGGTARDHMYSGEGDDILIGDGGQVTLTNGKWLYVETIDHHQGGGDDYLDSGPGLDIMFGGEISNTFVGTLGQDVMVGTYGRVTITGGMVETLVRLDSIDLITNTMTNLESGENKGATSIWGETVAGAGGTESGGTEFGTTLTGTGGAGFEFYFSGPSTLGEAWTYASYGTTLMGLSNLDLALPGDDHSGGYMAGEGGAADGGNQGTGGGEEGSDSGSSEGQQGGSQQGASGEEGSGGSGDQQSGGGDQQAGEGSGGQQQPGDPKDEGTGAGQDQGAVRKLDMGIGTALAGVLGWKVISGGELGKSGVIDRQSFRELAERQEKKRFKKWKVAGSGK
jgi:Ca2+-binding RTX toxin-like protein